MLEPCPFCGALPCDWVNNPHTSPASQSDEALVDALATKLAPFVCRPVHNGDCDDVAAAQSHARFVARAVLPIIAAREAAAREGGRREGIEDAAARDVMVERERQMIVEGWTPEHDDTHDQGELANAAACYAYGEMIGTQTGYRLWPWGDDAWKPASRRRQLVKAGALILAEIQRLDRALAEKQP